MDLSAFLQKLENHLKSSVASSETDKMNFYHLSNTLTLKFLSSHKAGFIEKLHGLVVAFIVYGKMRSQHLGRKTLIIAMNYLTNLAVETSKLVLGYEYSTLVEGSPTKSALLTSIVQLQSILESVPDEHRLLKALQHVVITRWDHDLLIKLISGEAVNEQEGLEYMQVSEHPRLLRLRLDLLMNHNCPEYASNFLSWLLKYPATKDDPYLTYLHLSHLCATGRLEDFYKTCMELPCSVACKVMTNSLIHPHHCFSTSCTSLLLSRALVNLTLLFEEYFCYKDIMKFWVKTEHLFSQGNHGMFARNIKSFIDEVQEPKFIVNLVEILHQEYQRQYTDLCTILTIRALCMSRHAYDRCRLYLPETFGNQSALRCMLALLHLLEKLYCNNTLIRVYCQLSNLMLMPCDAIYFAVEKTCTELQSKFKCGDFQSSMEQFECIKGAFIKTPMETKLFVLLAEYVDRFGTKQPWLWDGHMKTSMLSLMSEAGWIYDSVLKRFRRMRTQNWNTTTHNGTIFVNATNHCKVNNNGTGKQSSTSVLKQATRDRPKKRYNKDVDLTYNPSKSMATHRRKSTKRNPKRVARRKRQYKAVQYSDDDDDDDDDDDEEVLSKTIKRKQPSDSTDFERTDSDLNDLDLLDDDDDDDDEAAKSHDNDDVVEGDVKVAADAKAVETKVGEVKVGEGKVGEEKVGEGKVGEGKESEVKAGEGKESDEKESEETKETAVEQEVSRGRKRGRQAGRRKTEEAAKQGAPVNAYKGRMRARKLKIVYEDNSDDDDDNDDVKEALDEDCKEAQATTAVVTNVDKK